MTLGAIRERAEQAIDVVLLVIAAALLYSAPLVLSDSFDWVRRTTSESAAQGVGGAWVARLGFLVFAAAVWRITAFTFSGLARFAFRIFAICLVAVAAFAARPWDAALPYDTTEDLLHSIAASLMGFAFVAGVVIVLLSERRRRWWALDIALIVIATAIPLLMSGDLDVDGALQRLMFGASFVWFALARTIRARSIADDTPLRSR